MQQLKPVGLESETEAFCALSSRESDDAFQAAMTRAIGSGLEHAPVGVFVDRTPFSPRHFRKVQRVSGCSSSAGLCADMGERHTGPFAWVQS